MNNEQLDLTTLENRLINSIKQVGQPEYDGFGTPLNASAEISLKIKQMRKAESLRKANIVKQRNKLARFEAEMEKKGLEPKAALSLPSSLEPYFEQFSSEEQEIITAFYKNLDRRPKDLARAVSIPYQKVARFIESDRFKNFQSRVLLESKNEMGVRAISILQSCAKSEDEDIRLKVGTLLGEEAGVIKNKAKETEQASSLDQLYTPDEQIEIKTFFRNLLLKRTAKPH